ncbi:transcription factor bHLH19 [Capsicum annuum]|uniref:transcription factor bHLH19 n=1 Tax=Capsicum annuum TaxID=4072 RepID=UPI001FB17608|nr:transcription factor bHLH19 [Capsicum annuum]
MDDLTLIFSHHNNGEKSRKRLHEEDDLSCIISFNTQQYSDKRCHFLTYPPIRDANNSISFSKINNNNIGAKFGGKRRGKQAHEHLLAERNRRKKISELFGSLASLLPGLNKMDKASILEGATNRIKQLGERGETMQHHHDTKTNNEISSIEMVKSNLPQVEVRSLEEELLITILLYSKNQQKGIIDEILSVIQRLHLTIKTTNFMPFGSISMHITVVAQMKVGFCLTTNFLVEKLRASIIKL